MHGVDGDHDSDLGEGRICNGSENEEKGGGGVEISDGIAGTHDSRKGKGLSEIAPTLFPSTSPQRPFPPVRVHAEEFGSLKACTTSDGRAVAVFIWVISFSIIKIEINSISAGEKKKEAHKERG